MFSTLRLVTLSIFGQIYVDVFDCLREILAFKIVYILYMSLIYCVLLPCIQTLDLIALVVLVEIVDAAEVRVL